MRRTSHAHRELSFVDVEGAALASRAASAGVVGHERTLLLVMGRLGLALPAALAEAGRSFSRAGGVGVTGAEASTMLSVESRSELSSCSLVVEGSSACVSQL